MNSYVELAIRTKTETIDWKNGERLLESLGLNGEWLLPGRISNNVDRFTEPFLGKVSCEKYWASRASVKYNGVSTDFYLDFAWKRSRSLKSMGSVVHTTRNMRGQIVPGSISLSSVYSEKVDWLSLFREWCDIFPPQIGMLHIFTPPELGVHEMNNSFQIGSFNSALKPDVPNIGWGMFYGNEFSDEVHADAISASGFSIEKMGDGYLVRVTSSIQDVVDNFPFFSQRRAELRRVFRDGFFLTNDEPSL
ncbi:hypothetical protein CLU86_1956 [Acidovorax sp. 62]|uniref:hypothetical protein n=1 Tax=Acidovorax sp. 62 TaxID=2035203 RepID=UPI000C19DC36|nr:hypothetical protein [Acidovorax sp. 62]PIF91057.1 hypothetical protein CLU86_1956 [Acidovorax sp. 62]